MVEAVNVIQHGPNFTIYRLRPSLERPTWINLCPLLQEPNDTSQGYISYHLHKGDLLLVDENKEVINTYDDENKEVINTYVFVRVNHRHKQLFLELYDEVTKRDPSLKNKFGQLVSEVETALIKRSVADRLQAGSKRKRGVINWRMDRFSDFMAEFFSGWKGQITKEGLKRAMVMTGWVRKRDLVNLKSELMEV